MFVSSNFVNVGNLAFNMIFARWMSPEVFADLAILLSFKLGFLSLFSALQMAVSQRVAGGDDTAFNLVHHAEKTIARWIWIAFPAFLLVALLNPFGLSSPLSLVTLLFIVPFAAPLSFARGLALGRMDLYRTVLSANAEMLVRIVLCAFAWWFGLGLTGVAVALVISVIVGWLAAKRPDETPNLTNNISLNPNVLALLTLALPMGLLQLFQIVMLDSDVFFAKLMMNENEAGLAAALTLFQRIQFFACFGLAAILLPTVAKAVASQESLMRAVAPMVCLFASVSIVLIVASTVWPGQILNLLAGPAYNAAEPHLFAACACAILFTASYLFTLVQFGLGRHSSLYVFAIVFGIQTLILVYLKSTAAPLSLADFYTVKLISLGALFVALAAYAFITKSKEPKPC